MPWQIPTAKNLAARLAGYLEAGLVSINPDIDPKAISRSVRSARGTLATLLRSTSLELRQVHDHVAWQSRQLMVDTAEDEFTLRHGSIWGIERRAAIHALGKLDITGTAGTIIPANLFFEDSAGTRYYNPDASEIGLDGTTSISVFAELAGISGNLEADIKLSLVDELIGIDTIAVEASGIIGGADEETPEEHTQAILSHIRQRPHGGAAFDYQFWLSRNFDIKAVSVLPDWIGRGSVGLAIIMNDEGFGRAPTEDEINAIWDYLGRPGSKTGVRPVTAHVYPLAGVIQVIPLSVRLRPDSAETRVSIEEAWQRYITTIGDDDDPQNEGPIGATLELSRITDALSDANGEYAHDLIEPNAKIVLDPLAFPTPGLITFVGPE